MRLIGIGERMNWTCLFGHKPGAGIEPEVTEAELELAQELGAVRLYVAQSVKCVRCGKELGKRRHKGGNIVYITAKEEIFDGVGRYVGRSKGLIP